jgi:hypothetical protein
MEESAIDRLLWTTSEISFGANRTRGLDWHSRHTNSGARVRNTPRTHLPIARIDAGADSTGRRNAGCLCG